MIYCNLDNFHVSKEDLRNSPSRFDGVSEEVEMELRSFGTTLIQEGGTLLDVPQVVMATGQVLFHRFYCKKSMAKYDVESVAMTACWLACKLEEEPKHPRHVIAVFHRLQKRRLKEPPKVLDYYSREYGVLKKSMIDLETIMLREFGFIVHVDHPHKLVLNHLNLLHQGVKDPQARTRLMQEAFSLTNDRPVKVISALKVVALLRTTLCVRYKSETVACGLIFMAARRLQVALPSQPPWWELFDVRFEDICEVACEMLALYARPKAQYISVREELQASAVSAQPTPQASPLTANGQAGRADPPGDPSSPPLVQEGSKSRSEGAAEAEQEPLPNGVSHRAAQAAAEREEEQRPSKPDRHDRKRSREQDHERERERERHRDRDRDRDYARERDRERARERERDRSGAHDSRMRSERPKADPRDRRDADRRPDRERERDNGERPKHARPERSSSAAANGRSSRSPSKHSRRSIDWAAYKRGRDADDPAPTKLSDALLDDRDPALAQDAKRGRRDRSYSSSEDRD